MSISSDKGKYLERQVASMLRRKLGARVIRDRRSGAGNQKADISDYYQDIPLFLEIKNQETLKPKEWFRQADGGASVGQAATVVFQMDEELMCMLRFSDLVNFVVEIADQKAEIDDLRKPVEAFTPPPADKLVEPDLEPVIEQKKAQGAVMCREGHLADQWGYCNIIVCKYSRGYKKPKAKRVKK